MSRLFCLSQRSTFSLLLRLVWPQGPESYAGTLDGRPEQCEGAVRGKNVHSLEQVAQGVQVVVCGNECLKGRVAHRLRIQGLVVRGQRGARVRLQPPRLLVPAVPIVGSVQDLEEPFVSVLFGDRIPSPVLSVHPCSLAQAGLGRPRPRSVGFPTSDDRRLRVSTVTGGYRPNQRSKLTVDWNDAGQRAESLLYDCQP